MVLESCVWCGNVQAENVAANKELGQPVHSDQRVVGGVCTANETTENHVDGGCEENGCEEDERGLDDVGGFVLGVVVGCGSSGVSYSFTLEWVLVCVFVAK